MALITILGEAAFPLLPNLLQYAKTVPAIAEVLSDPSGYATRLGDLIVWHGSSGQRVLAGLQSLGENEDRIQKAVTSIESTQIATNAALGSLHLFACANLGLTALTGGLMLWRLEALNKRFDSLSVQLQDVDDKLDAQHKAHLRTAIQRLRAYDDNGDLTSLARAKDESQTAANIYGELTSKETKKIEPRLEVLNYRGRCYLLSLITELRVRLLEENPTEAISRFNEEHSTIESLARATFKRVIGDSPWPFLYNNTNKEGASLGLMMEIYQHAWQLKIFTELEIRNEADMFEYARSKSSWSYWNPDPKELSKRLKFLMACFEDIGRVESLKLLAEKIKASSMDFKALQKELRSWQDIKKGAASEDSVYAYSFS